jgi:hypothetical protein
MMEEPPEANPYDAYSDQMDPSPGFAPQESFGYLNRPSMLPLLSPSQSLQQLAGQLPKLLEVSMNRNMIDERTSTPYSRTSMGPGSTLLEMNVNLSQLRKGLGELRMGRERTKINCTKSSNLSCSLLGQEHLEILAGSVPITCDVQSRACIIRANQTSWGQLACLGENFHREMMYSVTPEYQELRNDMPKIFIVESLATTNADRHQMQKEQAPLKVFLFTGQHFSQKERLKATTGPHSMLLASAKITSSSDCEFLKILLTQCDVQPELILALVLSAKMLSFHGL